MRRLFLLATLLGTAGLMNDARAEPRFSARYRQDCTLCHQNPSGGGMRSLYASQFLVPTEMVTKPFPPERLQRIHPDLSTSVDVGADLRTIWVAASKDQPTRNFFQMQGDLYVSFSVDDRFSANLNVDQVGSTEIYGLGWVLPWSGYVKVGRFTPVFGWKSSDHNMFTREKLWFDQPFNTDTGIEFGVSPKQVAVRMSLLNGEPGANTRWDRNRDVAYAGNVLWQFHVAPVGFGLGGSIWYNRAEPSGGGAGRRTAGGPYGYVHLRRFTWLWEVDASRLALPGVSSKTQLLTSHELSCQVVRGLDVLATVDFADPDVDRQTGVQARYGIGLEALPTPFLGLEAMLRSYRTDPGRDVSAPEFVRAEVQLHLYY